MCGNKATKITEPGQVQNRGKTGGMKFTVELKSIKDQYLRNHTSSGYLYVRCFRCVAKLRSFYVQNQPRLACNFGVYLHTDFAPQILPLHVLNQCNSTDFNFAAKESISKGMIAL